MIRAFHHFPLKHLPKKWRDTLLLRIFGCLKVPMIGYLSPRVLHLDTDRCEVLIPLSRRAKNHLSSMYFGALCVGADCAGGLIAFEEASKSTVPVNIVFKSIRGDFLKRPQTDVHFVCKDGQKARELIEMAVIDGERHEREVEIKAYTHSPEKQLVAQFYLTLSVRARRSS